MQHIYTHMSKLHTHSNALHTRCKYIAQMQDIHTHMPTPDTHARHSHTYDYTRHTLRCCTHTVNTLHTHCKYTAHMLYINCTHAVTTLHTHCKSMLHIYTASPWYAPYVSTLQILHCKSSVDTQQIHRVHLSTCTIFSSNVSQYTAHIL